MAQVGLSTTSAINKFGSKKNNFGPKKTYRVLQEFECRVKFYTTYEDRTGLLRKCGTITIQLRENAGQKVE